MYEALCGYVLGETTDEYDVGGLEAALRDIRSMISESEQYLPNLCLELKATNYGVYLMVAAHFNRPGERTQVLHDVLSFVEQRLPGSWGMLYEHDDETTSREDRMRTS